RGIGRDCLDIDAGDHAVGRNDDIERRVAVHAVTLGEQVVVPVDGDRGGALGDRSGFGVDRNEIAGGVEFLEELQAGIGGAGSIRTGRNTGRVDGYDGVVGGARIAGEGDLVGIVRLQKVS